MTFQKGSAQSQALIYTVYATREGLVGGTTANGHVIQPNDHFVALPSGRALSPKDSHQFSVQVLNPRTGQSEVASVWDIGPWNENDDYWSPSPQREAWHDLPQGTPEAQAANQNGYNGGKDGSGRHVSNPAGIDLADGTFAAIGMTGNDYVQVTFLWTGATTGDMADVPQWQWDRLFDRVLRMSAGVEGQNFNGDQFNFEQGKIDEIMKRLDHIEAQLPKTP